MGHPRIRSHVRYWRTSTRQERAGKNPKVKIVGKKKRFETFCSVHTKQKQSWMKIAAY
jgi:hypothetical protein